ncbi:P-loop NTPase family protein [Asaia krungthepensis]|uniref:AAA family ATPase n=1 Tax=Asaia krungthepensis NRIC 0535 TaxID=1307925 RepID=A0ABQ0Q5L0_9PROT|nr:AAA family ATPase [Asaia krungthepensis]GBQ92386.1 hypothetical protein AA0535_2535 [Asaia krungthepensis NRIC 0535]
MVHTLPALGPRIIVMGPSNSGKSTLSLALAGRLGLPVIHLDLLRFEAGGFETMRPLEAFHDDHQRIIEQESWIIEGNYSSCLSERLERATGAILLDCSTIRSLYRYVRRCRHAGQRAGGFPGAGTEPIRLSMIRHIIGPTRRNRRRYRDVFDRIALPCVILETPHATRAFIAQEASWALQRGSTAQA